MSFFSGQAKIWRKRNLKTQSCALKKCFELKVDNGNYGIATCRTMNNFSFGLGKQTTTNEDKPETTNTQAMSDHDNMLKQSIWVCQYSYYS